MSSTRRFMRACVLFKNAQKIKTDESDCVDLARLLAAPATPEGTRVNLDGSHHIVADLLSKDADDPATQRSFHPCIADGRVNLTFSPINVKVVSPGSREAIDAHRLVVREYGARYLTGPPSSLEHLSAIGEMGERPSSTRLFAVTAVQGGVSTVIATGQTVVAPELGFLKFFRPDSIKAKSILGHPRLLELSRLAFHPALGVASNGVANQLRSLYRILAFRELIRAGSRQYPHGYALFASAPHAVRFMIQAGLICTSVDGFVNRDCPAAHAIRDSFSNYWQPGRVRLQPRIYGSCLRLRSVIHKINDIQIVIGNRLHVGRHETSSAGING